MALRCLYPTLSALPSFGGLRLIGGLTREPPWRYAPLLLTSGPSSFGSLTKAVVRFASRCVLWVCGWIGQKDAVMPRSSRESETVRPWSLPRKGSLSVVCLFSFCLCLGITRTLSRDDGILSG